MKAKTGKPLATMKTIVVANQKGGVGKTALARHLAFWGMDMGLRVLAVDLDVQGNFSTTFKNIAEANGRAIDSPALLSSGLFGLGAAANPLDCGVNISLIAADARIVEVERTELASVIKAGQARFASLAANYDLCVIDTGPTVSNLLIAALSVGDFAVSPCKPDRDALAGLAGFFENVVQVRDRLGINSKLASLGVLPNQVNMKRAYHRDVLSQMRAAWGEGVLPVNLYERAAIDTAKDRAVWSTDKGISRGLAATEMRAVCACVFNRMGMGA